MLADRREFPCQVINMSPGGIAMVAPVVRQSGRAGDRLCRSSRPARGQDRAHARQRLRHDDRGDLAQARQARRPAHLARQPAYPQSAGRPPPRPLHPAQGDGAADPAERQQCRLPRHRPVGVGRRDRHLAGIAAGGRQHGYHRQDARAGWSAISRTASPSNSPACSIPTSSKKTSPANSVSRR